MYEVYVGDIEHLYADKPEGGDVLIDQRNELYRVLDKLKNNGTLGSESSRQSTIAQASEELGVPVSTQVSLDDLIRAAAVGKTKETPDETELVDSAIDNMEEGPIKEFYKNLNG